MARVLFVDGDKQAREVFGDLLRARHHEALVARDGLEAQRIMRDRHPDVAVVEIVLPDRDGRDFIRTIRARWPKVRVIAMTGASEHRPGASNHRPGAAERRVSAAEIETVTDARSIGADVILAKPIGADALFKAVVRLAGEPD